MTSDNTITLAQIVADEPRGIIEKLAEGDFQSVLRITSKSGAVRSNHYHKQDTHICYLAKGKYEYYTRPADNDAAPIEKKIITAGQIVFTPPMVVHAMHFLEDSELYCFSTQKREQAGYEADTVRVQLYPQAE